LILIADSSALICLATCDSLDLLDLLFKEVKVPRAVFLEVSKEFKKESDKLRQYLENKIIEIQENKDLIIKEGTIELGELEAMILYKQLKANWLLVDDRRARRIAQVNEINIIGSLGVLLLSKKFGYIDSIISKLELLKKSDIFLSEEIIQNTIILAGESL